MIRSENPTLRAIRGPKITMSCLSMFKFSDNASPPPTPPKLGAVFQFPSSDIRSLPFPFVDFQDSEE